MYYTLRFVHSLATVDGLVPYLLAFSYNCANHGTTYLYLDLLRKWSGFCDETLAVLRLTTLKPSHHCRKAITELSKPLQLVVFDIAIFCENNISRS